MEIDIKTWLVPFYERLTGPWRRRELRRLADEGRAPIVIFFYHRIADDGRVPWTMSPSTFRRQIEWLRTHCDLITLEEAGRRMEQGNDRLAAHVTFDDGYADNLDEAIPLLIEWGVPCTYFVTLEPIVTGRPFPHDAERGEPLPPNSVSELRQMADAGIEIGAHTRTHVDLGRPFSRSRLHDEIITSADELSQRLGRAIRYFAFPFGHPQHISAAAWEVAAGGRFDAIASAFGGYNLPQPGADPPPTRHFLRFAADAKFLRFRNTARFDPRKEGEPALPRFDGGRRSDKPDAGTDDWETSPGSTVEVPV